MNNDIPDIDVLANFIDEAGQCLATLNSKLLMAESGERNKDLVDEMFRAAHSMKGSAGFLKLESIQKVTHNLETVLDQVRKDKLEFTDEVINALFTAFDTVSALLAQLTTGDDEPINIQETIKELEGVSISTPESNDPSVSPENELGWVPEWLHGQLSIDDVMEALIAKNTGQNIYVMRFSFSAIFNIGIDPVETYHVLEKAFNIQNVIPLEITESIWQPLANYDYDIAIFGWGDTKLTEILAKLSLPEIKLWELNGSSEIIEPEIIKHKSETDMGAPITELVIKADMQKHLPLWISETSEELDLLERALIDFEQSPQEGQKHIDEMFRMMHRLKSSAASMGLSAMSRIAHNCESLLDRYRQSGEKPAEEVFKVLFKAKDILNECLRKVRNNDTISPDTHELDMQTQHLLDQTSTEQQSGSNTWQINTTNNLRVEEILASGNSVFKVSITLQDDVPLADLRYAMILRNIENSCEVITAVPSLDELDNGIDNPPSLEILIGGNQSEQSIRTITEVDQVKTFTIEEIKPQAKPQTTKQSAAPASTASSATSAASDTVRVDTARLDQMMNVTGELVITKARVNQLSDDISHLLGGLDLRALNSLITQYSVTLQNENTGNGLGFSGDKLKRFEDMISQLQKAQDTVGKLRETSLELHRHTSNLQNSVMQVRMVPVGPLFQRFHRLIRDVSKSNGRKARLILSGEGTELDKKLIDELSDPLTHLIRNSVDHGLETPEERLLNGKDETGTVTLYAFHEGGHICIRVEDDGRGLDLDKIKAKAISNGILTEQAATTITTEEAYNLIFSPGFSTAAKVTNISGRGVGMDIVKSKITELKGKIDIDSVQGQSCSFTIRLPLTLAMIEALLVSIGGTCYAFPLESVKEIVDINDGDIHKITEQRKIIKLRENVISLMELQQLIDAEALSNDNGNIRAVVTKDCGETLAIPVDHVIGEEDIVVKALSEEFRDVVGISGASVLGDGKIALILDVPSICDSIKNQSLAAANEPTTQNLGAVK